MTIPQANGSQLVRARRLVDRSQDLQIASQYAKAIVGTAFLPEALWRYEINDDGFPLDGRDGRKQVLDYDASRATATIAILAGDELGLDPVASLRSFYIIGNVPALYVKAARALVQSHGHHVWVDAESNATQAIVYGQRLGEEHLPPTRSRFHIDRAKAANLYPGNSRSVWRRDPAAMLEARATGIVCNRIGSDVLLGVPFAEEMIDAAAEAEAPLALPPGTGTASTDDEAEPEPKTKTTRRRAPKRAPAQPASAPPMPAGPQPEVSGEPTKPEPPAEPGPITPAQRNKLFPSLRRIGINPDVPAGKTAALAMINAWVAPHVITSTSELTEPEASTVLDNLAALGGVAHPEHPSTEDDTNERNPHDE